METESKSRGCVGAVGTLLFPAEPRRLPWGRPLQVALRTVHIIAMAMVLGGLARGGTHATLLPWILATLLSGALLLGIDLWKSCAFFGQGAGVAVLLKLVLLGLGNLFPEARFEWYLAATAVASVGSHMAATWRHFSFLEWRVVSTHGKG
jgi:hypothetical protein